MAKQLNKQALPKKEADLFRSLAKFYELKQYKRGIKAADAILKKVADHGETLAMKGLILNCMGADRKEEAHDLVRRGLRADIGSHVCWHVYGLIRRAEREYPEAIKAYKSALRIDPDNIQILRDLGSLQIQLRDLRGYAETRRRILTLKSNNRAHWMSFAAAQHAAGELDGAISVIDAFWGTLTKPGEKDKSYDNSELMLYRNQILTETGRYSEALEHLDECDGLVVDRVAFGEQRAKLLLLLGRHEVAFEAFLGLMKRVPDNYAWHRGLQCARLRLEGAQLRAMLALPACSLPCTAAAPLLSEQIVELEATYSALAHTHPRSQAIRRMPLLLRAPLPDGGTVVGGGTTSGSGDDDAAAAAKEWRRLLTAYIHDHLRRGVPSLGSDLMSLMLLPAALPSADGISSSTAASVWEPALARDPYDVARHPVMAAVTEIVDEALDSLRRTQRLPVPGGVPDAGSADAESAPAVSTDADGAEAPAEPPTTLLWAMFLQVQVLERTGRLDDALVAVEACLEHTPTAVDLYHRKARLLKKSGALSRAASVMDAARRLDKSDRYVNNKATKYLLRAGAVARAEKTVALFTRHEGDPQHTLYEMQCMWYELCWAEAALRRGDLGPALKKALAVEEHFRVFVEDQFDFHTYCMRKMTLRAYSDMLRMTDRIYGHKFFCRAASIIIRAYLEQHARPKAGANSEEPDMSTMTAAEKKRHKAKLRKDAKKKQQEEDDAKAAAKPPPPPHAAAAAAAVGAGQAGKAATGVADKGKAGRATKAEKAAGEDTATAAVDGDADDAGSDAGETEEPEAAMGRPPRRGRNIPPPPPDDDPLGHKLLEKDSLAEAGRVAAALTLHAGRRPETHVLAFDVAERRGKPLLALRALVRGRALAPSNPELLLRTVRFYQTWGAAAAAGGGPAVAAAGAATAPSDAASAGSAAEVPPPTLSPVAARVVTAVKGLLGGSDVAALAERMAADAAATGGSLPLRVAAAQALVLLSPKNVARAETLVAGGFDGRGVSLETCEAAGAALKSFGRPEAVETFHAACVARFPLAEAFGAARPSLDESASDGAALEGAA